MNPIPEMELLITGGSGQMGRTWQGLALSMGIPFDVRSRSDLDICAPGALDPSWLSRYTCVVNCAAWTDVEAAEKSPERARTVNTAGVAALADACARAGVMLLHYSTEYVFDGRSPAPYRPGDPTSPRNVYGRTKAEGEEEVRRRLEEHLIVRTSWVYAPWSENFLRAIARQAVAGTPFRVVDDQTGTPTNARHLAEASLGLLLRNRSGTFHITDGGACTRHEFACAIVGALGLDVTVEPCTSGHYPGSAERPRNGVLDVSDAESVLGTFPGWRTNMHSAIRSLPEAAEISSQGAGL